VGLERGPLGLVSTTEELLGRKSSRSGIEKREYGLTTRRPLSAKCLLFPTSCYYVTSVPTPALLVA
jgi:hypothetical protein